MNDFNANIPIYLQVVENIKTQIMNGRLKPGDKISSVRELALEWGVNPNTVQRAFVELEREGFIRTERAVGRYVTENMELIEECRVKMIEESIDKFLEYMRELGVSKGDIIKYLSEEKLYGNIDTDQSSE